ncbi:MAG: ORF6N domain-containing protein [Limisphaerales bacterium]
MAGPRLAKVGGRGVRGNRGQPVDESSVAVHRFHLSCRSQSYRRGPVGKQKTSLFPRHDISGWQWRAAHADWSRLRLSRELAARLADPCGAKTKALNQAVKRDAKRFPDDFTFVLSPQEKNEVVTNCDHLWSLDILDDRIGGRRVAVL